MEIKLNFINRSNDMSNAEVAIFQRNVAAEDNEHVVAWTVIQNCGPGENHPFTFAASLQVSASDSFGNYTPAVNATPGEMIALNHTASGDVLAASGPASSPTEIQVINNLPQGAIGANVFKDGRLLAATTSLAPQQAATFEFRPTLWIGAVSEVTEGHVMNSAILSHVNTELSLLGVVSADIVMTGGGPGQESTPLTFTLQNVVQA